jgi:hypothetical protein
VEFDPNLLSSVPSAISPPRKGGVEFDPNLLSSVPQRLELTVVTDDPVMQRLRIPIVIRHSASAE